MAPAALGRGRPVSIAGISDREAASLARMGIRSTHDLVFRFPRWHVSSARIRAFSEAREGASDFFQAVVSSLSVFSRGRLHIVRMQLVDSGGGRAQLYWFNRPYVTSQFRKGAQILIYDVPERTPSGLRFSGKTGTCEVLGDEDAERLRRGEMLVYYKATTVITQERARSMVREVLADALPGIDDPMPKGMASRHGLSSLGDAIRQAHIPSGWPEWERARRRLAFEQLFLLQVALGRQRRALARIRKGRVYTLDGERAGRMRAVLPFVLTSDQERVLAETVADMAKPSPMNRLIQGDVGSGKTVIAAVAAAIASDSGFQSAVMAPTEILAEQHFHTFRRLLGPAGVRVGLLISGQSKAQKRQLGKGLEGGYFDVVVGTHALIEEGVEIPRLGLAVIDERHKFGVRQRARLEAKGRHPDLLMMTATPLPRALVLTQYGDTSLSLLKECPPGRGGTTTKWFHGAFQRETAYRLAEERMTRGERVFAVFPLVEKSENLALRDATKEFERLKKRFPSVNVGLIHGKMAAGDKEAVMQDFAKGSIVLLVATTVVEVGIDVPDATVMLVEHANRFGLAQLHQLRGRVGRGPKESWCILLTTGRTTSEARERLTTLVATSNGFELAEKDLSLRGPGEMFGTRQHGMSDLEHVDVMFDLKELDAARQEAEGFLEANPKLSGPDGTRVRKALSTRLSNSWGLVRAS